MTGRAGPGDFSSDAIALAALGRRLGPSRRSSAIILPMSPFAGLPGAEFVADGLRDLERGVVSVPALLVSIGAPRLRRLGVAIPRVEHQPEHRLYAQLQEQFGDAAHGRYNAWLRRLVSFERALECVS